MIVRNTLSIYKYVHGTMGIYMKKTVVYFQTGFVWWWPRRGSIVSPGIPPRAALDRLDALPR